MNEKLQELKEKRILIVAIVGICGTTESGSIDPLDALGTLAAHYNIHFHVDAAWGGPLIYSTTHSHKLFGISKADTITIDGHKQLYTPMGLGLVLLKTPTNASYIRKTANYVIRATSNDQGKHTLEGSRPAHIVHLHASLVLLGRVGLDTLVTQSCALVAMLAVRLERFPSGAFQVLFPPMANILLFRYVPEEMRGLERRASKSDVETMGRFVERIQAGMAACIDQRPGVFTSRTTVLYGGEMSTCFRVVLSNPNTKWSHIQEGIGELLKVSVQVEREEKVERVMKGIKGLYPGSYMDKWSGWPYEI